MSTVNWLLAVLGLGALLLVGAACAKSLGGGEQMTWKSTKELVRTKFPSAPQLSVDDLARALEEDAPPLLIDVREAREYEVSHLPGAVHAQGDRIAELAKNAQPGQQVVLYCSVGYRSSREAEKLLELGVKNVTNLEGSIFEWANDGHRVVRGAPGAEELVEEVHPFDDEWGTLLDRQLWEFGDSEK